MLFAQFESFFEPGCGILEYWPEMPSLFSSDDNLLLCTPQSRLEGPMRCPAKQSPFSPRSKGALVFLFQQWSINFHATGYSRLLQVTTGY